MIGDARRDLIFAPYYPIEIFQPLALDFSQSISNLTLDHISDAVVSLNLYLTLEDLLCCFLRQLDCDYFHFRFPHLL